MELAFLLAAIVAIAIAVHLTRHFALLAIPTILLGGYALYEMLLSIPASANEFLGQTLVLDPAVKLFLFFGLGLTSVLALLALLRPETRNSAPVLYWVWVGWLPALVLDSFPLAVVSWATGLVLLSLGLMPRRAGQTGGGASYLVVVVLSVACLLLANRFFESYPLTPEQTNLIEIGVLLLTWALGMTLAVVPLHLWLASFSDEAPLTTLIAFLGLGQPVGFWLLFTLMRRYLWLTEKSNLLGILALAGLATAVVGGLLTATERRKGRMLAYASLFMLGLALLDMGRARLDLLWMTWLELFARATALALFAAGVLVFQTTRRDLTRGMGIAAVAAGGAAMIGLPFTPAYVSHLPIWSEYAVSDTGAFIMLSLAALGVGVGVWRILGPMLQNWAGQVGKKTLPTANEEMPTGIQDELDASDALDQGDDWPRLTQPTSAAAPRNGTLAEALGRAETPPPVAESLGETVNVLSPLTTQAAPIQAPSPSQDALSRGAPASETPLVNDPSQETPSDAVHVATDAPIHLSETQSQPSILTDEPSKESAEVSAEESVTGQPAVQETSPNVQADAAEASSTGDSRHADSAEEEPYDPVEALRQVGRETVSLVMRTGQRIYRSSPRVWNAVWITLENWPLVLGIAVLVTLALTLLVVGISPTLLLDPLSNALGHPDYLR